MKIYSKDLEVFRSKSMVKGRNVFKVLYLWRYLEFSVFAKNFINFCLFLAQHFFPASEILQKLTLIEIKHYYIILKAPPLKGQALSQVWKSVRNKIVSADGKWVP